MFGFELTRLGALLAFKAPSMWVWHTFDSLVYSLLPQVPNKSAATQLAKDVMQEAHAQEGDTKRDDKGVLRIRVDMEDYPWRHLGR